MPRPGALSATHAYADRRAVYWRHRATHEQVRRRRELSADQSKRHKSAFEQISGQIVLNACYSETTFCGFPATKASMLSIN
jgi:hypothetical protein